MDDPRAMLAATLEPLGDPVESLEWLGGAGVRGVQLSATQPGLRPRTLDGSARRELRARLKRLELTLSGLDLWIPPEHFTEPANVDRAAAAAEAAVVLAADLGRVPVSMTLPADAAASALAAQALSHLLARALHHGVTLVDFQTPPGSHPAIAPGVDLALVLDRGGDPLAALAEASVAAGRPPGAIRLAARPAAGARGPLGAPDVPLLRRLREAFARDRLLPMPVLDARGWHDPRAGVRQSLAAWEAAAAR